MAAATSNEVHFNALMCSLFIKEGPHYLSLIQKCPHFSRSISV